jgi:1-acyl-sn-glycerol-3-phosphate acyltransferase
MEMNLIRMMDGSAVQALLGPHGLTILWVFVGLVTTAAVGALAYRVRFWVREGNKLVEQPGYVTPRAPMFARITRLIAFNFMCRRYIGPIKRIGSEHMKDERRLIILINHQTERDVLIIPTTLRLRVVRALMAVTQIFGIRKPAAAWMGVIAVHHDKNPSAALRGMIKILQKDEDSDCIVFPQGQLIRDNVLKREQFFDGALMIAKKTAEKSKRPVAVLPAAIAYDRDPSHATWLQRLLEGLGWKNFRHFYGETMYGAAVAFGKPIPVEELPDDYKAAMTLVFDRIVDLSKQSEDSLKRPSVVA